MWLLEHPDLPVTERPEPSGAPLFSVDLGTSMAPLCQIDFQAAYIQSGVNLDFQPTTQRVAVPAHTGDTVTLTVTDITRIDVIEHNGLVWQSATDAQNLHPGEFTFDQRLKTLVLKVSRLQAAIVGLPLIIMGGKALLLEDLVEFPDPDLPSPITVIPGYADDPDNPGELVLAPDLETLNILLDSPMQIETDVVDSSLFACFYGLPLLGEIEWTLNAEGHPSGSVKLQVGVDFIAEIRSRFRKGTELSFAGIGFSVTGYDDELLNIFDHPSLEYDVSLSLGGKWERKHYNRPVYLNPVAAKRALSGSDNPFEDPNCSLQGAAATAIVVNNRRTTIQALAAQNNVSFVAPIPVVNPTTDEVKRYQPGAPDPTFSLLASTVFANLGITQYATKTLSAWDVAIPNDAAKAATVDWESNARDLLRLNGCFMDWNSTSAVQARDFNAVASWRYSVAGIKVSCQGDTEFSPTYLGYAAEYAAVRLAGKFSEPPGQDTKEDTQGNGQNVPAKWIYAPPKRKTLYSGDIDADVCPVDIKVIKSMSLNHTSSGRTAQRIIIEQEGGIELRRETFNYGFEYLSTEVLNPDDSGEPEAQQDGSYSYSPIKAEPGPYWRNIGSEVSETLFDANTRYITGTRSIGSSRGRFLEESDKLEFSNYEEEDQEYKLYFWQDRPVLSIELKLLAQFASFYTDAANVAPALKEEVVCHNDGTSTLRYSKVPDDPNFAYPMFELASRSYKNSFASAPNPKNEPDTPVEDRQPPLTQGEETDVYKHVQVLPSRDDETDNDMFIEYTSEASAQGPLFSEFTLKRTFSDAEGRPGAAQRLASLYKKEEPEKDRNVLVSKSGFTTLPDLFEYILCTPGHEPYEPSGGSLSYDRASYFSQGMLAARLELKYQDITESVSLTYQIPFNTQVRPLDKMAITAAIDHYDVRVTSVKQKVAIQGLLHDFPLCSSPGTEITAGLDREIPITLTKRKLPRSPTPALPKGDKKGVNPPYGLTIGDLGFDKITSRANF